jgi:hypothetical protein
MDMTEPAPVIRRRKRRGRPIAACGQGGKGEKNNRNNYLAETPKKKAGAPLGNRNARRHGACSVDSKPRRDNLDALIHDTAVLAAQAQASALIGRAMRALLALPPSGAPRP